MFNKKKKIVQIWVLKLSATINIHVNKYYDTENVNGMKNSLFTKYILT